VFGSRNVLEPLKLYKEWMQVAEARVKAGMWVSAALRLSFAEGGGGAVLRRGDEDAGGILAVLRGREGFVVLSQVSGVDGERAWMRGTGADPVDQDAADAYVARQVGRDPDLWAVEFDAPDYLPPFEAKIL
jgi:hypothetical protein